MQVYRTLLHSIDNHGIAGTLRRLILRASAFVRASPAGPAPPPAQPHPFDLQHHTDTSGYIPGAQLVSGSPSDLYNTAYYAISPSTLTQALALIQIPPGTTSSISAAAKAVASSSPPRSPSHISSASSSPPPSAR